MASLWIQFTYISHIMFCLTLYIVLPEIKNYGSLPGYMPPQPSALQNTKFIVGTQEFQWK